MSNSTDPKQEQLLLDLYRRLEWDVLHVDDEDFNPDEVKAIMQLLDVLDPIEEDEYFQPEPALARFKERYHINNDTEVSAELSGDVTAAKTDSKVVDIAEHRATAHGKDESLKTKEAHNTSKRKGRFKISSPLGRIAAVIVAAIVLSFGLNIGSYAVADKPFMEVVSDGVNSLRISTRGNAEKEQVIIKEDDEYTSYDSWDQAERELVIDVLVPAYIPEGYLLDTIESQKTETYKKINAVYLQTESNNTLGVEIEIYDNFISERVSSVPDGWTLSEETENARFYVQDDLYLAVFTDGHGVYCLRSNDNIDELKKIVNSMK